MNAFDNHKKKKAMPSIQDKTTKELLDIIQAGFLSQPQGEALTELYAREVKQGDADDYVNGNGVAEFRGGTRPFHAPHV